MNQRLSKTMEAIEHRGARITYVNYEGLSDEELAAEIRNNNRVALDLAKNRGAKRDVLILVNAKNAFFTGKSLEEMKASAAELKPFVVALAAVGVSGFKTFVLELFGSISSVPTKDFDDIEKAKDWLVDQLP
jgi:hypothetical protein